MRKTNLLSSLLLLLAMTFTLSCSQEDYLSEENMEDGSLKAATTYAEVTKSGSTYYAKNNGTTYYSGTDYIAAINAAIGSLPSRSSKATVKIKNSGASGNSGGSLKYVNLQSNTILDFSGCTFTCNSSDLLIVPVYADRKTNIEVKNLVVSGNPRYGIWFKGCTNMIISNITMTLTNASGSYGLGIRVDNSTASTSNLTINGTINIKGGDMSVETYGLDGFSIGNVTSSNNYGCGVLLNQSKNGSVGTVTGNYNCRGGGYATFRVANNNGPNVTCTKVYSRNSGRGFFSVSGSNGTTVGTVDIANCTSHGIFLEDASNTKVNGGTVSGCNPNVQHVRTSSCTTKVNGKTYTAANGKW